MNRVCVECGSSCGTFPSHAVRQLVELQTVLGCVCAGLKTGVIGVPKTIDGDLKNGKVATSFGFDTACKVSVTTIPLFTHCLGQTPLMQAPQQCRVLPHLSTPNASPQLPVFARLAFLDGCPPTCACSRPSRVHPPCSVSPTCSATALSSPQVYSEQIGNLMIDAASARKYYHFVRLMGRAASHIALECALQTHPQAALICEEISHYKLSLAHIVNEVRLTRLLVHAPAAETATSATAP